MTDKGKAKSQTVASFQIKPGNLVNEYVNTYKDDSRATKTNNAAASCCGSVRLHCSNSRC